MLHVILYPLSLILRVSVKTCYEEWREKLKIILGYRLQFFLQFHISFFVAFGSRVQVINGKSERKSDRFLKIREVRLGPWKVCEA